MTPSTLDVTTLPDSFEYKGVQLVDLVDQIKQTVEFWGSIGLVKQVDSLGFAILVTRDKMFKDWDDPSYYVDFVGGWGEDKLGYIANAVRKMRPALRESEDTLTISERFPEYFKDTVQMQDDDGSFGWGDFPHGGATFVTFGNEYFLVAVSALTAQEDDLVASFIGKLLGKAARLT